MGDRIFHLITEDWALVSGSNYQDRKLNLKIESFLPTLIYWSAPEVFYGPWKVLVRKK